MLYKRIYSSLFDPSFQIARDVRRMLSARKRGFKLLSNLYRRKIARRYSCYISYDAVIADDVYFPHPVGIVIGSGAIVGRNCVIYQNVTLGRRTRFDSSCPKLGDGCMLYAGSMVLGDIELQRDTTVAAGAIVTHGSDIPGDVLIGAPARSHGHTGRRFS